jgi:hypothetical protein
MSIIMVRSPRSDCNSVAIFHFIWYLRRLPGKDAGDHTCVALRPWSTSVRASAVRPLMAQPMCSSISATFSLLFGTYRQADIAISDPA